MIPTPRLARSANEASGGEGCPKVARWAPVAGARAAAEVSWAPPVFPARHERRKWPLSGSRRGRRMYRCKPVLRTRGEPLVYFTRLRGWGRKLHAISAGSALKSAIRSQRRSPRAFWAGQAIYWHGVHPVGRTDLHIARVALQLDDGERSLFAVASCQA